MKRTGLLIDSFSPLLSQRIDSEIERRMLIPALNTNYWWKKASMNWNPWICSNWLACVKFCEHDSVRRDKALAQIASAMNAFADGYPDDGGCDEGPTYWDRAAASLYECASMMPNSHSLPASFISSLKKMAAYCYATYIADGYCLSFADSHGNRLVQQPNVMYPFALYVDDPVMRRFSKYIAVEKGFLVVTAFLPFYPLVTNSLSITSDFCLSPLFIRRDKNGTKPENKISKNTFEPIKSLRHIALRLQSFCKRAH